MKNIGVGKLGPVATRWAIAAMSALFAWSVAGGPIIAV